MSRIFIVAAARSFIASLLIVCSLSLTGAAQDQKPIFAQDLEPFGFQTKPPSTVSESYDHSSVTFLSEDLVLVAINKRETYEEMSAPLETSSRLATLLLFRLDENKLIGQEQKRVATFNEPIQATQDGHFLLSDGTGVQLCSAELLCSARLPLAGPAFVSPKGTRAIIGGTKGQGQELIDTTTLDVLKVFAPNDPLMVPGDEGFLALKGTKISVMVPGQKDRELQIEELVAVSARGRPTARFLNGGTIL